MKVFFDTGVLVAGSEHGHPHYSQAWPALLRVKARKDRGFMSAHSIAEMYAVLTRLPVQPRIHPGEAARIITENVPARFEMLLVEPKDSTEAVKLVAAGGWGGAKIYDAPILGCAAKSGADRIYTFNLADFRHWRRIWNRESARHGSSPVVAGFGVSSSLDCPV